MSTRASVPACAVLAAAAALLLPLLPCASASAARWAGVERAAFQASSFAGATTSAVFPVPNATNAASQFDSLFPAATVVGFVGPTPTGDEAEEIATATAVPKITGDAYPLLNPSTSDNKSSSSFDVLRYWGNLAPMFSVDSFGLPDANELVPDGCALTQVHLLHRHGARYPTSGEGPASLAAKLHNATVAGTGFTATGDLAFLNTWTYKLGEELLTPFGRQQLFDLGVQFRLKYGELLKDFTGLPVFRTTSQERMVQSAQNFAAGFFGIPDYLTNYRQLITIESDTTSPPIINNTLNPFCANQYSSDRPEIGDLGETRAGEWAEVYLKGAVERIKGMVVGVNLTVEDVLEMQETCAYETVALGSSAFCDFFTQEEWLGFEYFFDLLFWYSYGPGNPTTAATGIGYVQELVARLTQTPISVYNTTANATLDGSNVTFPLDQPIFVDATHDTAISSIIVAMNFTSMAANGPLPTDHIPENQTYFVNQIAPFASRLVGQVMTCPSSSSSSSSPSSPSNTTTTTATATTTHIRWLLNDAVVPLTGLAGCPPDDAHGRCPLATFVAAMHARLAEVDYAFDCTANYTLPDPDGIVDGKPPVGARPL